MSLPSLCGRGLVAAVCAILTACVGSEAPGPEPARELPAGSAIGRAAEPTPRRDPLPEDDLDTGDLEGLGELGVLPNLVQRALAPSTDCDFDDALSTCQ